MNQVKRLLWLITLCLPVSLNAQSDTFTKGIQWTKGLSWEQVKQKAKKENKYIFVDCHATWCVPCKKMEQEVFPAQRVGEVMNEKFICVRLQIDTSKTDDDQVKAWYSIAHEFIVTYKIASLPCYFFFSPEGEIVHRDGNYVSPEEFIKIAGKALDPSTQFYTLLKKYNDGKMDYQVMPYLASTAQAIGDAETADSIALEYKENYLDKVDDSMLFKKDILDFITRDFFPLFYSEGSKGRYLDFFIRHGDTLGKIQGYADFSSYLVKAIIKKEELLDKLYKGDSILEVNPNWQMLENNIIQKYGNAYAKELLLESELGFHNKMKNWKQYADIVDKQISHNVNSLGATTRFLHIDADPFHISDPWALNSAAWTLFLYCNNRKELKRALKWSELSIRLEQPNPNVQCMDTKANLLYKLGRVKEAIETEYAAIEMDDRNAAKEGEMKGGLHDDYLSIIEKMKKGQPTWVVTEEKSNQKQ